jgi:hypothetical protein
MHDARGCAKGDPTPSLRRGEHSHASPRWQVSSGHAVGGETRGI